MTDIQVFTEQFGARTFPWNQPVGLGYSVARIICVGAGGGGGSGCRYYGPLTGFEGANGGFGGGGGGISVVDIPLDLLPDEGNRVSLGLPGYGGAPISTDSSEGSRGTEGSGSSFYNTATSRAYVAAGGGAGGWGGYFAYYTGQTPEDVHWKPNGGIAQLNGQSGGLGILGGSGKPPLGFQTLPPNLEFHPGGAGGGGGGGSFAAELPTPPATHPIWVPKPGGTGGPAGSSPGGYVSGGVIDGAAGENGSDSLIQGLGGGGGGGAAGLTVPGGKGGNGGLYGGGGGGGGNGLNGVTPSGAGGNGGESIVIIITY